MAEAAPPRYRAGQRWPCPALSAEIEPFVFLWGVQDVEIYELDEQDNQRVVLHPDYRVAFTFLPEAQNLYGLSGIVFVVTTAVLDAGLTGPPPELSSPPEWLPEDPQDWVAEEVFSEPRVTGTLQEGVAAALAEVRSLSRAIREGREQLVTQLLLENPDRARQVLMADDQSYPLHVAATVETPLPASLLLLYGADVAARNSDGRTALHLAAEAGRVETVRLLLDAGADIDALDQDQYSPLQAACEYGSVESLRCAAVLLDRGARADLHSLARLGRFEQVQSLLASDAQTLSIPPQGPLLEEFILGVHHAVALRCAAENCDEATAAAAIMPQAAAILTRLLDRGVDCNSGRALYHAVQLHDVTLARILLEHGADPNKDIEDQLFLPDVAVLKQTKKLLKRHGAASAEDPERVVPRMTERLEDADDDDARFGALEDRCEAWSKLGQYERALADANAMIHMEPDSPLGYFHKAWILATCPDEEFRDGARALELAEQAVSLDEGRSWVNSDGPIEIYFGTEFQLAVATAHAENGQFEEALEELGSAEDLATGKRLKRLKLLRRAFKASKPYREAPPPAELAELGRRLAEEIEPEEVPEGQELPNPITKDDTGLISDAGDVSISDDDFGIEGIRRLLDDPNISKVVSLRIVGSVTAEGAELLASAFEGPMVKSLVLGNELGDRGGLAIVGCSRWSGLKKLGLGSNKLGNQVVAALASSPHLLGLAELYLSSNRIRVEGVRSLASSPHLRELSCLDLSWNRIRSEGIALLASSPYLGKLRSLQVHMCRLGPDAVLALASGVWHELTELGLDYNRLGDRGLSHLATTASSLPRLSKLGLGNVRAGAEGVAALAASALLDGVTELHLSNNPLGVEGVTALAKSTHLGKLVRLNLADCRLGDEGARLLAEAWSLPQLQELEFRAEDVGKRGEALLRERFGHRARIW